MKDYIKKSSKKTKKELNERHFYGTINVYIKDKLPKNVDIDFVLLKIENIIPRHFVYLIDSIFIGDFDVFKEKHVNAVYEDGSIYLTNEQSDDKDMIDDIVHEIAHSVEELMPSDIYSDGILEKEFIGKRNKLNFILKEYGHDTLKYNFNKTNYSKELDDFLYKKIGYSELLMYVMGLFISPYAVTSLREYFARGFEEYFLGDRRYLKNVSPQLFNKISLISNYE